MTVATTSKRNKNPSRRRTSIFTETKVPAQMDTKMSPSEIQNSMFDYETSRREADIKNIPKYMMDPYGMKRSCWDAFLTCLIMYNAITIPFTLAFSISSQGLMREVEYAVDLVFAVDIILNFGTADVVHGALIYTPSKVAQRYMTTWFVVDFLSIFPFQLIFESATADSVKMLKLLKIARMMRLLRLSRLVRIMQRVEQSLSLRHALGSVIKFFSVVLLLSHFLSCAFCATGEFERLDGWVHYMEQETDRDLTDYELYLVGYYWTIMTITTVGFGDIEIRGTYERIFSIVAMMLGAGIFAYGVSNIVALMADLNSTNSAFHRRMDHINAYMRARELPAQLKGEIREFFYHAYLPEGQASSVQVEEEGELLQEMSSLLRAKVAWSVNEQLLRHMPFFMGADPQFVMDLALHMRSLCFSSQEVVVREGQVGDVMYFTMRGKLEVVRQQKQVAVLGPDQYFGEMCILQDNTRRKATVRTLEFCELRVLARREFVHTMDQHPKMKAEIAELARERAEHLQKMGGMDKLSKALTMIGFDERPTMVEALTMPLGNESLVQALDEYEGRVEDEWTLLRRVVKHLQSTSGALKDQEQQQRELALVMKRVMEGQLDTTRQSQRLDMLTHRLSLALSVAHPDSVAAAARWDIHVGAGRGRGGGAGLGGTRQHCSQSMWGACSGVARIGTARTPCGN